MQGATDLGLDVTTLPLYYGLVEGGWRHWARVWDVPYEWLQSRFDEVPATAGRKARTRKENMEAPGITSTRWFDAVNLPPEQIDQRSPIKAFMVFGHGGNTVTRMPEAIEGMNKLELLVVADPHPTTFAALDARQDNTYLLPICTSLEMDGSRTASNRSIQWGEQIVQPAFESRNDYEVLYKLATKLGFADKLCKNIKVENGIPVAEDILREINRGGWSTGYCGQSPERLKAHMRNQHKFDLITLRAPKDDPEVGGDYYGLPWPCWGKPELKHPGSAILYNTNMHVKEGGGTFRARFGTERNGQTLLAEDSFSKGSDLTDGYPEFTFGVFKKLGWDKDLTEEERATILKIGGEKPDTVSWATDLSGGIQRVCMEHGVSPFGNGKARANAGTCPTRCRSTASRSTRRAPTSWRNTRPAPTSGSCACPTSASRCRRRWWTGASPRTSRSSSPPAVWSSTRAAARRPGRTRGLPSCSRTCSSRSTPATRPIAASRTGSSSGSTALRTSPRPR